MGHKALSIAFVAPALCLFLLAGSVRSGSSAQVANTDSTLKILESAYKAGILTEDEYRKKRAEILGPEGKSQASTSVNTAPAKQSGNVYRHPTGISVWYPSGWQAKMLEGILQIVPPGVGDSAETFESYFITAESVAGMGINHPNHPEVLQYLEEQMQMLGAELGVFFQRSSEVIPITIGQGKGQGIKVDWTAQSNVGPVKASTYVCIIRDYGLVLAGVGVKDLLARREKDILRIFASLSVGEGKLDSRLVGTWKLTSTHSLRNESVWETDYSRAQMVSETQSTLSFHPDGNWTREDKSEMIVGAGPVWLESKDRSGQRGRWNADGGHLFMLWEDESFEDYQYRFEGNQLKLKTGKTAQIWTRTQ